MARESTLSARIRQYVQEAGGFYLRVENVAVTGTFDTWIVLNQIESWCELKFCKNRPREAGLLKNNHPLSYDQINFARMLTRQKAKNYIIIGMEWDSRTCFVLPGSLAPLANEMSEIELLPYARTKQQLLHILGVGNGITPTLLNAAG